MTHTINKERTKLVITIDADEREMLRRMDREGPDSIQSDKAMLEFFEPLIANTELEWIDPSETGDLTEAPLLCIFNEVNRDGNGRGFERWGYEPYQVISVLETLRDKGECVFSNQW
jgi:hypothetical protein